MGNKFTLIGSGLAGGLLAAYLGRRGYEVDLYERRADPREGNIVGGRSINLALSTRGIHALEQLGIADEVLQHAIPMRGRMIHDKSGDLHFAPYDVDPNKCINSIGRAALNTTVIEAAQRYPNVRVHFNHVHGCRYRLGNRPIFLNRKPQRNQLTQRRHGRCNHRR